MTKAKKSHRWYEQQQRDPFVKAAKACGWRARSAYKLLEINEKYTLFQPGMRVLDLGAAPGGWSQVARHCLGQDGRVIAVDQLVIEPLAGVETIQGDIHCDSVKHQLVQMLGLSGVHIVLSDMAPNLSGHATIDQSRSIALIEAAYGMVSDILVKGGAFLVKLFQGAGFDDILKLLRQDFTQVNCLKPKASRARSKEVYCLARSYQGAAHDYNAKKGSFSFE